MKKLLILAATVLVAACSDSGIEPPPYPEVQGSYHIDITFDDLPATLVNAGGTIVINQPSRDASELGGTANVTVFIEGSTTHLTTIRNASVSEAGVVAFEIPPANPSSTWAFSGSITAGGDAMSGTHQLSSSGSTDPFRGRWNATRN